MFGILVVCALYLNTMPALQANPYAGQEHREIKALSVDEIQNYLAGKGAGMAKAAELNHYPGPTHVLELAGKLGLDDEQIRRTRAIVNVMQREAADQGKALIEKERELDRLFASGTVTPASLRTILQQIGTLQAEIRRSHLQAHVEQQVILTKTQVAKYDELRGYASKAHGYGDHIHKH